MNKWIGILLQITILLGLFLGLCYVEVEFVGLKLGWEIYTLNGIVIQGSYLFSSYLTSLKRESFPLPL